MNRVIEKLRETSPGDTFEFEDGHIFWNNVSLFSKRIKIDDWDFDKKYNGIPFWSELSDYIRSHIEWLKDPNYYKKITFGYIHHEKDYRSTNQNSNKDKKKT